MTYERAEHDFYVEEKEAVEGLLMVERFNGSILDPAAGIGTIPTVLRRYRDEEPFRSSPRWGASIKAIGATDLIDRNHLTPYPDFSLDAIEDFLLGHTPKTWDNIISNPPYATSILYDFIPMALDRAIHKVALLLPVTILTSGERIGVDGVLRLYPPARVHFLSWRIQMPPGMMWLRGEVEKGGGKKDHCWVVWDHGHTGPWTGHFMNEPIEKLEKKRKRKGQGKGRRYAS